MTETWLGLPVLSSLRSSLLLFLSHYVNLLAQFWKLSLGRPEIAHLPPYFVCPKDQRSTLIFIFPCGREAREVIGFQGMQVISFPCEVTQEFVKHNS